MKETLCWKQRYLWKMMHLGCRHLLTSFFSSCVYFYRLLTFFIFRLMSIHRTISRPAQILTSRWYFDFLFFSPFSFSCFCRSGNDILCPFDVHAPRRRGLCAPSGKMAFTAEERTWRILIYSGGLPPKKVASMCAPSIVEIN